jgi:hypothetical protein
MTTVGMLSLIGIAVVFPTVTGDDDVAILEAVPSVVASHEIQITPVTGRPDKLTRECQAVPFGNTTRSLDVPSRTLVVSLLDCHTSTLL